MKLYCVEDRQGSWLGAERDGSLVDLTAAGVAADLVSLIQ
jgi:hypothetical protein